MNAVEVAHITKTFAAHRAVSDLSFVVPAGTIYGFIGPNGSGKTTTLWMIMRILHPDEGTITVLGENSSRAANNRIGYLPEERGLYKHMRVRELLRFYADLKGARHCDSAINQWLDRMGLSAWAEKKIQTLSKGMSQKVQFIATVVSRPDLVILDEPFSGLDPVNGEVLREAVIGLKRDGMTVIFSTHDMGVAEKLCDFILMIHKGKKVLDGTVESIKETYGTDTVRIGLEGNGHALSDLPGVMHVADHGRLQELRLRRGTDVQALLRQLMHRSNVRHFELAQPSLHDIFVRIAGPDAEEPENV